MVDGGKQSEFIFQVVQYIVSVQNMFLLEIKYICRDWMMIWMDWLIYSYF